MATLDELAKISKNTLVFKYVFHVFVLAIKTLTHSVLLILRKSKSSYNVEIFLFTDGADVVLSR